MGAVQIDIYRSERDFYNLNFSDVNVIKWLLMHRDKVDIYFDATTDRYYNNAGIVKNVNQELIHIYAYLDELIEDCVFNQEQTDLIRKVCVGYTFKDIAELSGNTTSQNVKGRFKTICKIISAMNNEIWSIWVSKHILAEPFKECTKCRKSLPHNEKFFRKPRPYCKKCESNAKRT